MADETGVNTARSNHLGMSAADTLLGFRARNRHEAANHESMNPGDYSLKPNVMNSQPAIQP